uniref:Ig-like domain-containing protein n=1 Tax=Coturnix japonica TaxID=93934 RepID=A0A8C2TH34_COTJA
MGWMGWDGMGSVGALQVNQDPPELWAAAGTNVSLRCQLQTAQRWTMARVTWLKDGGHEVLCEHRVTHLPPKATTMPCATPHIHLTWSPPHANLSLHGAQEGDAGRYVCHVTIEVPYLATATGNGTMLHVSAGMWGAQGGGQHLVGSVRTPMSVMVMWGLCVWGHSGDGDRTALTVLPLCCRS